jgi:hypothetical protein
MTNDDSPSNSNEDTKTSEKTMQANLTTQARQIKEERISMDKWFYIVDQVYNDWNYSPSQRIAYTAKFLNEEQKVRYEQNKDEITQYETRVHINDIRPICVSRSN